jgi:galactosylceramidase
VEIGADGFAANAGGEPAIRHFRGGPLIFNGTNFFLMREAVARNPSITLYGLSWSFPGWYRDREVLGQEQAEHSCDWLDGVRQFHRGKLIISIWNEKEDFVASAAYAKLLRRTLDARGLRDVRVLWPDSCCMEPDSGNFDQFAKLLKGDPELDAAVHAMGSHYPVGGRTCPATLQKGDFRASCAAVGGVAANSKKPLYDSEAWGAGGISGNDQGGATMARLLSWEPLVGGISATVVWQILWGSYDGVSWANNSLIRAASPWSGAFEVLPPGHAVAHHTRFSDSSWTYLKAGSGSGWLKGGGSHVTRVSADGADFSTVLETFSRAESCLIGCPQGSWTIAPTQNVDLQVKGAGCAGRSLALYTSRPFAAPRFWLKRMAPLKLSADCRLTLAVAANTQLTLTTLAPRAAAPVPPSPLERRFPPLPWSANFSGPSAGGMPSYFQDFNGAFSLASSFDGRRGLVMEQTARYMPIFWLDASAKVKFPLSIFGDSQAWQDVSVHADVALLANPIVDAFAHTANCKGPSDDDCKPSRPCFSTESAPLKCSWANTSVTLGVRVGAGHLQAPSSTWQITYSYGYFLTIASSGVWQLTAANTQPPPPPAPAPPPPVPRVPCPGGWRTHANGYWKNLSPPSATGGDKANGTVAKCAAKCEATDGCQAFEIYDGPGGGSAEACYLFLDELQPPFTANRDCITCCKVSAQSCLAAPETALSASAAVAPPRPAAVRLLASGNLPGGYGLRKWHKIGLAVSGCILKATVDGRVVSSVDDKGCDVRPGWASVGSGWHAAQFAAVSVAKASRAELTFKAPAESKLKNDDEALEERRKHSAVEFCAAVRHGVHHGQMDEPPGWREFCSQKSLKNDDAGLQPQSKR